MPCWSGSSLWPWLRPWLHSATRFRARSLLRRTRLPHKHCRWNGKRVALSERLANRTRQEGHHRHPGDKAPNELAAGVTLMESAVLIIVLIAVLGIASLLDVRSSRIPNWLTF